MERSCWYLHRMAYPYNTNLCCCVGSTVEQLCWIVHRPHCGTVHQTSVYPASSIQGAGRARSITESMRRRSDASVVRRRHALAAYVRQTSDAARAVYRRAAEPSGVAKGWTWVHMFTPLLLEVAPEIHTNPTSFYRWRGRGGSAPPPDPRYRIAPRARHVCPPHIFWPGDAPGRAAVFSPWRRNTRGA